MRTTPEEKGWKTVKTDLYTPFLDATKNVFQLMLDLKDVDTKSFHDSPYNHAVNISIGVVGDLTGEVVYSFPDRTSVNMVNIMSGMELDSVDDFVTSAISEIANIISGNVLTMLADRNVKCDILPPKPADKENEASYAMEKTCCLSTSAGDVCLHIRLNPSQS